ncbi:50S ribosomal protein L24 [Phycisphaerales bacterium AB-hyl4]|uniref:Large ribosomal subunit protein uL24 n=1 Tax=Natronomicrosphaera hydrolytica TaxID=3242702 RepID=A0ABV4U602_9BACT
MARHIRKGDMVIVVSGSASKRRGADGRKVRDTTPRKVMRVFPAEGKVIVEGVNVVKRHVKPSQSNQRGGITEKEMPIDISNVMPAVDGKPTRVRFETRADGSKVRLAARNGEQLGPELKKAR